MQPTLDAAFAPFENVLAGFADTLDAAFAPFVDVDVARFDAACWLTEATAPAR